eukprot:PhF_6_TR15418/c0_g1_i1/m.23905/K07944/ARL3; ADP-ribosylation factor-like protein 3
MESSFVKAVWRQHSTMTTAALLLHQIQSESWPPCDITFTMLSLFHHPSIQDLIESMVAKQSGSCNVLMLGLDNSGKTSILKHFAQNEEFDPQSALPYKSGVLVKRVTLHGCTFLFWDLGGARALRDIRKRYFDGIHCVMYVIDSADRRRFEEAMFELDMLLRDEKSLAGVPVLIYANKQDLIHAWSSEQIKTELLDVPENCDFLGNQRPWMVQGSSVRQNGEGLKEGLDWLLTKL